MHVNVIKLISYLFVVSSVYSSKPLEVIYSDVWSSPIFSKDGFKYYVLFVDHFTKYMWLYPLKKKSDVHDVITHFKTLVEFFFWSLHRLFLQ